jgi:hypothetical protein
MLLGEHGFNRIRRESGTFERRKFGLRRHRPALVTFVRVRVIGTWRERVILVSENIVPQHNNSAPAHTWQVASCVRTFERHDPIPHGSDSRRHLDFVRFMTNASGETN